MVKLQDSELVCPKTNQDETNEIYKKKVSKSNPISGVRQFSVKLGVVTWSTKPLIILIYLNLPTIVSLPVYPKVLPPAYPFLIDNAYICLLYTSRCV